MYFSYLHLEHLTGHDLVLCVHPCQQGCRRQSLWLVSRLPTVTAKAIFQLSLPPGKEPRATKALIHQLSPSSDPLEQTHWARKIALTAPRSACLMTEDLPLAPSRVTVHCFLHGHCSSHTTVKNLGEKECRAKLENDTTEGKMSQRDSNKKPRPAHQRLLH